MWTSLRVLAGALVAAAWMAAACPALATDPSRLLTVDDLVGLEAFGRADLSPDGRWAIYEKRAGYDTMPRVEANGRSTWAIMTLWLADLDHPEAPARQLLPEAGLGVQRVAWSPSGDRLLVTRLQGERFEYGIVSLADRSVRWTGLTPDLPLNGAPAAWASNDAIVLVVRPDGSLPLLLGYDRTATARRAQAWERTALGREPSRTVMEAHGGVLTTETPEPRQSLVRIDPATLETRVLLEGRISDFALSPDGRMAAVVRREAQIPLARPELLHMEDDRRHRLSLTDLETGETSAVDDDLDIASHLLRWSADSRAVLVWTRRDGQRWTQGRLAEATTVGTRFFDHDDLDVGSSAEVVLTGVKADWIGAAPVVYARRAGGDRHDWHLLASPGSPRTLTDGFAAAPARIAAARPDALYVFADGGFWAMSATGVRRISPASAVVREATIFDLNLGRRLRGNEAPRRSWAAAIGAGGERLVLTEGGLSRLGGAGSPDDRFLAGSERAALLLRPTGLSETLQLNLGDDERSLDAVNADLADIVLTEALPIRHGDLNGADTTSWLFLPKPEARPIRGLIVKVYPGWADNLARVDPLSMTYSTRPEVILNAGYAVLSPSMPGETPVRERGDAYVRSVDLAVDAALAAFPELPADRMTLWGHSFGGHAALEIATRSSRYRSYIASAAYSDMSGVWGEFDAEGRIQPENGVFFRFNQGWVEVGQGGLASPPWVDPELYAASSPFLRADRITRPVLLLTADLDFVPMSQAERMFSAILRNDGEARLVTYWGEKHLIWSPANIRDYYHQIFDWLAHTLPDAEGVSSPDPGGSPTVWSIPPAPPP